MSVKVQLYVLYWFVLTFCTLRVMAWRKWNEHPFTTDVGKVDRMALMAADSKSLTNVRCPTSPNFPANALASAPNIRCRIVVICLAEGPMPVLQPRRTRNREVYKVGKTCLEPSEMCRRKWLSCCCKDALTSFQRRTTSAVLKQHFTRKQVNTVIT